jgi:hypothetical protein
MKLILPQAVVSRARPPVQHLIRFASRLAALILALIAARAAIADAPAILQVSQVLTDGSALVAYVAVRDEAGDVVSGIEARQIHATVGTEVADVESFAPFAETGEGVAYLFLVDVSSPSSDRASSRCRRLCATAPAERPGSLPSDRVLLEDLGSTNKTFLNGVAIHAPHPVDDGDLIRVGRSEFRIRLQQDSDA